MKAGTCRIAFLFLLVVAMLFAGCASPLINAAKEGDTREMERIIASGADINASDMANLTALHYAVADSGRVDAVSFLIERGANVNARDIANDTPLHWAVFKGNADMVRLLLSKGADPGIVDKTGNTPLMAAHAGGKTVIVRLLREAVEYRDKKPYVKDDNLASSVSSVDGKNVVKSDVDEPPVIRIGINKNAYAIVIGIEQYRQSLPKADYAEHDAQVMTEYLTKVMGYPEVNVVTLINDHATNVDFAKYFEKWLLNNVEKDGTVFVYYSGHGAPNPKTGDAFLVPYDADPAFIEETGYSIKRLYDALGKLPAKNIVVAMDSCFSGAGGRSVIAKGARPLVMNLDKDVKSLPWNMTVLSASSGDEISSTYDEKGHGLFTYFFLKGLKGEADANGDNRIDTAELFEYLKPNVTRTARKAYNNEQSPQMFAPAGGQGMQLR
ncbi:MAG: ankyrin repeat domain-containing protein [Deltaproteobacteria bacterium]|nr:ankyrin repeat domain-containing protein [Deltaproteobacteria bacterium]